MTRDDANAEARRIISEYDHDAIVALLLPNPLPDTGEGIPDVLELVKRQADDEGLWFIAQSCAESYLQQELRKLHTAIESTSSDKVWKDYPRVVAKLVAAEEKLEAVLYTQSQLDAAVQAERDALTRRIEREAWSFIRRVLTQGHAQQQDYAAGKYDSFEYFMAHIDDAARNRLPEFHELFGSAVSSELPQEKPHGG